MHGIALNLSGRVTSYSEVLLRFSRKIDETIYEEEQKLFKSQFLAFFHTKLQRRPRGGCHNKQDIHFEHLSENQHHED